MARSTGPGLLISDNPGDAHRASPLHLLDEALCAAVCLDR